jgi:phospholipid-binding lipoprotein MlaA
VSIIAYAAIGLAATTAAQDPVPAPSSAAVIQDDGVVVIQARPHSAPGDPFLATNAKSFAVTQSVDDAFTAPVSLAYKHAVPDAIRDGLRNFLNNTREPVVFLNFLLQLKPGKAGETLGRFAVNTTIGAAGLFDVAKKRPFNLPRRRNGFANSMGYYGVKPGPFIFLPLIGPTTLRDAFGAGVDRLVLPLAVGMPFDELAYAVATGTISALDNRVQFDDQLRRVREESSDPYTARRELYLQMRQAEIDELRGKRRMTGTVSELKEPPVEPSGALSPAAPRSAQEEPPKPQDEPKVISLGGVGTLAGLAA